MDPTELIFAVLIFLVLGAVGLYFARQQVQALRWLRTQTELPAEDRSYVRRQARLRLIGCVLLWTLGAQVAAAYVFGLEARARALGEQIEEQRQEGGNIVLNAEQKSFRTLYGLYWITALLVLLAIVFLAAYDIWAIRRYGQRHLRKIHEERRAMLEGQVLRFRSQRNGHV